MLLTRYFSGSIRALTRLDRVLVLLVASLLSLQLLGVGHHKDDHVGYQDNCASCFFAHQVPHGLPDVEPALVPARIAQWYRIDRPAIRQTYVFPSFLIPDAQAPPRA